MDKRGGEYQDFASKIFCLTVRKSFVGKPFWVSLIWVSKKFMLKGVRLDFSANFFCLAERENFAGNTSVVCFRKFLAAKWLMDKEGEYQYFPSKISCLTVPEIFVGQTFRVSLISGLEKFYASEGYVTIFHRKVFVSQCRKIS